MFFASKIAEEVFGVNELVVNKQYISRAGVKSPISSCPFKIDLVFSAYVETIKEDFVYWVKNRFFERKVHIEIPDSRKAMVSGLHS